MDSAPYWITSFKDTAIYLANHQEAWMVIGLFLIALWWQAETIRALRKEVTKLKGENQSLTAYADLYKAVKTTIGIFKS